METKTDLTVAKTILHQLGGNRFIAMTGAKNFIGSNNSMSFKIGRNSSKTNYIRISLNVMDLYKMEFLNIRSGKMKTVEEFENVYSDALQAIFTSVTGLNTRL